MNNIKNNFIFIEKPYYMIIPIIIIWSFFVSNIAWANGEANFIQLRPLAMAEKGNSKDAQKADLAITDRVFKLPDERERIALLKELETSLGALSKAIKVKWSMAGRIPHPFEDDPNREKAFYVPVHLEKETQEDVMALMPSTLIRLLIQHKKRHPEFGLGSGQRYNPRTDKLGLGEYPLVFPHEVGHLIFLKWSLTKKARDKLGGRRGIERFWDGNCSDVRDDPETAPVLSDRDVPPLVINYQQLVGAATPQKLTNGPFSWDNSLNEHFGHNVERLCYAAPFLTTTKSQATTDEILTFFMKLGIIDETEVECYRLLSARLNNGQPVSPIRENMTYHVEAEWVREAHIQLKVLRKMQELQRRLALAEEVAIRLEVAGKGHRKEDARKVESWSIKSPSAAIEFLRRIQVSSPLIEERIKRFAALKAAPVPGHIKMPDKEGHASATSILRPLAMEEKDYNCSQKGLH